MVSQEVYSIHLNLLTFLFSQKSLGQKDFDFRNPLLSILKMDRLDKKANKTEFWVLENSFCSLFIFKVRLLSRAHSYILVWSLWNRGSLWLEIFLLKSLGRKKSKTKLFSFLILFFQMIRVASDNDVLMPTESVLEFEAHLIVQDILPRFIRDKLGD